MATAIGLFAAIPAVVPTTASRDIDRIAIQQETFIEEFSNILQRNVGAPPPPAPAGIPRPAASRALRPSEMPSVALPAAHAAAPSPRSTWCPFIDVMLVLLIIFMVTAPLITTGVIDLPTVGKAAKKARARHRGAGRRQRRVAEAARRRQGRTAHRPEEPRRARQAGQGGNADTPVVISADKAVKRYEAVVKVMDTLQRAGVQRVGLSVKSSGG